MSHRILNFDTLATNALRTDALTLAEAGYAAIDTGAAILRKLSIEEGMLTFDDLTYPLEGRRVFFVGVGKCAIAGAVAVEHLFGERLTAGIAFDVSPIEGAGPTKIETYIGTHPLPSEVNERATERILELLSECRKDDLVLMLISGGGSTLLCQHDAPMTCTDESVLWSELTARGASIQEINTVRKHISRVRGGGLAKAAYPAEVLSFIISDVPGNDIEYIASGPTVLDTTTCADAEAVLAKYAAQAKATVTCFETPKEPQYFARVTNRLLITNQDALAAMKDEAVRRGYTASIMNDRVKGEATVVGREILETLHTVPTKTALLYAGETTVTLGTHAGGAGPSTPLRAGGRNQEMSLAVLGGIRDDELILPLASDGHDNSDHAGAIADAVTRAHASMKGLSADEHLADHCSYEFFKSTGDALHTSYTESNVSDIIIAIKN